MTSCNGLRISTGHLIPYDTSIGFLHPSAPFSTPPPDLPTFNTGKTQPPLTSFYPFRYSDLRCVGGEDGNHQFTQTGRTNINFGHGPASCPGRWFASSEIKCIVIELLRRYDVGLGPNGEGETSSSNDNGKDSTYSRPQATVLPGSLQNMPDFAAAIYFRNRSKDAKAPV